MSLFLVRHGEAEHNVDRMRMAHTHDSKHALTENGRQQAEAAARFLRETLTGKCVLYSSPYRRTIETAQAIHRLLPPDCPFYENPLLREWELGNLYDFANRSPEAKREFKAAGPFYFRYPNGESLADVYQRAALFMHAVVQPIQQEQRYENIVVVTHGGFIHMLLAFLLNWPMERLEFFEPVENGAVVAVRKVAGEYQHEKLFVPTLVDS
ncbi:histidine phosphatase family protein [Brevibacillus sp. SYP-B805]|uniref:histidine phosphatase family protein n=1 Tax=Brevibacillus sp. SYP-B805 TaxID=1578199 RepID=UPI0013EE0CB6|nr:histidine phosphatase family protein [Brevibacillus sp. SYP-B805]NGQ94743.1 histidine phosphatase family protein [Brevibacillus sp. SYP-B805]